MSKVIKRKNITISQDLSTITNGRFSKNILLNFTPDEMIIKQLTYSGDATARSIGSVRLFCNTINEDLGSFYDGCIVSSNLSFLAKNYPLNTEWSFQLYNGNGTINTTFNDELFIHLEFVQYN